MTPSEIVLFEKCPLCGQANITTKKPTRNPFSKARINPCPNCFAEFAAADSDKYQLTSCEPRKLAGLHNCADHILRGCYLDTIFSKHEWNRIAEGAKPTVHSEFLEISKRYHGGKLPIYLSANLPFKLERGEAVHCVSSPVCVDERKPSKGIMSDKGDFYLTSKRIIFTHPSGAIVILLEDVEHIEDSPPGFSIKEKDSFVPLHFFPPRYDPIFAAICGAIHNLKKKH